ncbi:MAG: FAD-binding oxidoreductase [Alphaproteobacteria bacterium]|jgi:D-amino-acid oxidase|nr:MAG: FAD-binding oxidoreductase [Alphaproteobacteria bacterium]
MPAAVTRSLADDHPAARLRGGEILPDPDFSLLRASDAYLVGIRPHREGGVCLKLDDELIPSRHGSKFLIHNYGHGGAGITLSFGCASVVADHVATLKREIRRPSIAVIGCGVIGLTVAAELRRRWRNLRITIYAKDLDVRRTTSFVAAGQFEPSGICAEYESEEEKKILADYLRRSRDRIMELHRSSHWHTYGIALRRDYTLDQWNGAYDECTPHDVVPQYRSGTLPFAKLNIIGREYRTWLINPTILLPQLVAELKRSGVRLRKRQFASRDDFAALRESIIVNCTGYGAKALMNDDDVVAKRGHLVVLRRTLPKQFYFFSGGCGNRRIMYAFCRHSDIVVGGTVETGNDTEGIIESDRARFDRILANARAMFDGRPRDCVTA